MDAHVPVFTAEVVEALRIAGDGTYVDATFGRGGHSRAILERLGPSGRLIALDADPQAVGAARRLARREPRLQCLHESFAQLAEISGRLGLVGRICGIVLDLGVSSPQLDEPERGFSFRADGPLDMRMNPDAGEPVSAWLNAAPKAEIAATLRRLGEEPHAARIAREIERVRGERPLRRTGELAALVASVYPARERAGPRHPATRTFQALRIHVNRELDALAAGLDGALGALAPGGRLAVVSFHSLEDRIVKRFMRAHSRRPVADLPIPTDDEVPPLRRIGSALRPGTAEVAANPRARSAVLRVCERISGPGQPR